MICDTLGYVEVGIEEIRGASVDEEEECQSWGNGVLSIVRAADGCVWCVLADVDGGRFRGLGVRTGGDVG